MTVLEHKADDFRCSKCGAKNRENNVTCWKCGIEFKEIIEVDKFSYLGGDQEIETEDEAVVKSEKYPALRTISGIYMIIAWIVGIGSFITLFYGFSLTVKYGTEELGISLIIYSLIAGFIGVISMLAISEIIKLVMNIANDVSKIKENSIKSD